MLPIFLEKPIFQDSIRQLDPSDIQKLALSKIFREQPRKHVQQNCYSARVVKDTCSGIHVQELIF